MQTTVLRCALWLVASGKAKTVHMVPEVLRYQSTTNTSYTSIIHASLDFTMMRMASFPLALPTQIVQTPSPLPLDMASSSDPKPSKRRAGRRRLPPLAPGPALQFVVANHPDDFRAGRTMRHVRSHVMYKHRENRASSDPDTVRSREGSTSIAHTPSPSTTDSDAGHYSEALLAPISFRHPSVIWNTEMYGVHAPSPPANPLRMLAARILSATAIVPARSAPTVTGEASEYFPASRLSLHESLDDLKCDWIRNTAFFCHG